MVATIQATVLQCSTRARQHATEDNPHFLKKPSKIRLNLAPCFANDVRKGIEEKLDRFLMRYVSDIGGIVVGYDDLHIAQRAGRIMYDCPFVHFDLVAKFTVFAPPIGSKIEGVINKQSPDHIGLLVYDVFNASIASQYIKKKYFWDKSSNGWQEKATGQILKIGSTLSFAVQRLSFENDMCGISGNFDFTSPGAVSDKIKKEKRKYDDADEVKHQSHSDETHEKKKKKKKKHESK